MLSNLDAFSVLQTTNGCFIWCHDCQHAVRRTFIAHLERSHQTRDGPKFWLLLDTRPDLKALVETRLQPLIPAPWPNGVRPVAGIPVEPGFQCLVCQHLRASEASIKRHLREKHNIGLGSRSSYRSVYLQTWFPTNDGGFWWTVDYTVRELHELQLPTFYDNILAHGPAYRARLQQFLAPAPAVVFDWPKKPSQKPRGPIPSPDLATLPIGIPVPKDVLFEPSFRGTQQNDDSTRFLKRSGWRPLFQHLPYVQAMRTMTMQPRRVNVSNVDLVLVDPATELGLGRFLVADEAILALILALFKDNVLLRCQETVARTLLAPLSWLQSPWPDRTSLNAFAWHTRPDTLRTYTNFWARLLCLLFRARLLDVADPGLERAVVDVYAHLEPDIHDQLDRIWTAATAQRQAQRRTAQPTNRKADIDEPSPEPGPEPRPEPLVLELEERLMALNILVLQQMPMWINGSICNLLSKFIAIMSFDLIAYKQTKGLGRNFVPISTTTSQIAKLVWCARLFGLEYSLPAKEYLLNGWRAAITHKRNPLRRLKEFRDEYLCLGTSSSIG